MLVHRRVPSCNYSSASYALDVPAVLCESAILGLLLLEVGLSTAWMAEASGATSGLAYFMVFTSFRLVISCFS
jgi:hypothetical protein